jgi:MoaA/NifB/PqqE/SkfB family radical SAM enzyme
MIKPYPVVHFEISGKCNGKCPYCSTGNKNQAMGDFVNPEIFDKTIEKIIKLGIFNREISTLYIYNWGEPFLHPQFNKIIQKINENDITYGISTNLSILPKDLNYNNLVRNLKVFMISMPGFSQKSYDKIHGFNFETIKSNILIIRNNLLESNFKGEIRILYHIYQFNLDEIYNAERFASKLGIDFIPYYAGINDWWQKKDYLDSNMSKESIKRISNDLFLSKLEEKIKISSKKGCSQHNEYFMIDEKCNVGTCCSLPTNHPNYKCGNILEDNMEGIIYNKLHQDVCNECIEKGLAIEEGMVSNPSWYYDLVIGHKNIVKYKLDIDDKFKAFSKGEINEIDMIVNIVGKLATDYIAEDDLIEIFKNNIFTDLNLLTKFVSKLYEKKLYKFSIVVLEYILNLNVDDENTLYNLAYISYTIGRYDDTLLYLSRIKRIDDEIDNLAKSARANIDSNL